MDYVFFIFQDGEDLSSSLFYLSIALIIRCIGEGSLPHSQLRKGIRLTFKEEYK